MLNNQEVRGGIAGIVGVPARLLISLHVSPDAVTLAGATGAVVSALATFPRGQWAWGTALIVVFALSDLLDGTMARMLGRAGPWGAFLDSVLDRVTDGVVMGSVVLWVAFEGNPWTAGAGVVAVTASQVVSYTKARGESVGFTVTGGIAERAERLIILLVGTGLAAFGLEQAIDVALWLLAVLASITVVQRMLTVRRQALAAPATGGAPPPAQGGGR